jgi:hypothetical protein
MAIWMLFGRSKEAAKARHLTGVEPPDASTLVLILGPKRSVIRSKPAYKL